MVPIVLLEYGAGAPPPRGVLHAVDCANVPVVDDPNAIGVWTSPPNCEDEIGILVGAFHPVLEIR